MKEHEDVLETQMDNVINEQLENKEENTPVINSLFPNYGEIVEPVTPVEKVTLEESEVTNESTEVNNVFGENVIETNDQVINSLFPNYSEAVEPVAPVEKVTLEESEVINEDSKEIQNNNEETENNYNPMENPNAKIVLNKEVEETKEIDPELEKINVIDELKSNKSLLFVLGLGAILVVIMFAIPYVSELLG